MKNVVDDVQMFHLATGLPVLFTPQIPSEDRISLRRKLIVEECCELMDACNRRDLVGIADAQGDIIYVTVGMALEFGIPLDRVWNEIQRANMAKVDAATGMVRRRDDGKILKPNGWVGPNIAGALGL